MTSYFWNEIIKLMVIDSYQAIINCNNPCHIIIIFLTRHLYASKRKPLAWELNVWVTQRYCIVKISTYFDCKSSSVWSIVISSSWLKSTVIGGGKIGLGFIFRPVSLIFDKIVKNISIKILSFSAKIRLKSSHLCMKKTFLCCVRSCS